MASRDTKVSIIIPVHNALEYTKECIESIRQCSVSVAPELIVVNNGSSDSTGDYLKDQKDVTVITNASNLGFAAAVNLGLLEAQGDFLVILNNDTIVTEDWLERLLQCFDEHPHYGILGPVTNYISGAQQLSAVDYNSVKEIGEFANTRWNTFGAEVTEELNLRGFCLLFKREVVETIGGFDERFGVGNFEDDDFCMRANKYGIKSGIARGVFIHHHGSVTFDAMDVDYQRLLNENGLKFAQKWNINPPPRIWKKPDSNNSGLGRELSEEQCQVMFEEANAHILNQNIERGLGKYREILSSRPDHLDALHNLHAVLYKIGKHDEGMEGLKKITKMDPGYADVYNTFGLIEEEKNNLAEASKLYRECLKRDVNNQKAYDSFERVARKLGKFVSGETTDFIFWTGGMKFDGTTLYKKGLGGSESALYNMAKNIAAAGYSVKVFNNVDEPGNYDGVEYADVVDFYIYNKWNSCKAFISSRSFKPFYNKIKAKKKVVWLHDRPNVNYVKDYDFDRIDFSDLTLFTLSEFHTAEWQKYLRLPENNFYITRNGYDPARFEEKNIERNENKIIYSSRPDRGLEVLIEVFPKLKKEFPELELHVFTYFLFDDEPEAKALEEKLVQPGVVFRGSVSQKELAREMQSARLLTYPSIFKETSCITVIEAMAAGLPVVSSDLAALPETLMAGSCAILIEGDGKTSEYQEKYLDAVRRLLNNEEEWKRLSKNGMQRALKYFDWKQITDEWLTYFSSYINSKDSSTEKTKTDNPTISLCMIVKNEEKTLPVCLESIQDLVDEIILVDTGSTDKTKEIAGTFNAKIYDYPWADDFARARNESLKYATGDWILYLDADEMVTLDNKEKIKEVVRNSEIAAVNMIEHIPQEKDNLFETTASDYCRLFRNDDRFRFTGRVHEQILDSINAVGGKVLRSTIRINHWGYAASEKKKTLRKERNLKLLLLEELDHPDDPFVHYNLGMTYYSMNENDKAISYLEKAVQAGDTSIKSSIKSNAASTLSQIYFTQNALPQAKDHAQNALRFDSNNLLALYLLAGIGFQEEDYAASESALEKIEFKTKSDNNNAVVDKAQLYLDLGNCTFKMGKFAKAIKNYKMAKSLRVDSFEATYNLALAFINVNNLVDAEEHLSDAKKLNPGYKEIDALLSEIEKVTNAQAN